MNTPSYLEAQVVDKEGKLTPVWQRIMQQLLQELKINFSDEGILLPPQTASNITLLIASVSGTMVYDSTNDKGKLNEGGVWKTIVTV